MRRNLCTFLSKIRSKNVNSFPLLPNQIDGHLLGDFIQFLPDPKTIGDVIGK